MIHYITLKPLLVLLALILGDQCTSSFPNESENAIHYLTEERDFQTTSAVTLVTAYFPQQNRSRHSEAEYAVWMANLLSSLRSPLIVFTVNTSMAYIDSVRHGRKMKIVLLEDVWSTEQSTKWKDVYPRDGCKEFLYHSELYAIWNLRPWFLFKGSKLNPFASSYFFWIDIGCVRDHGDRLLHFPDVSKLIDTFHGNEKRMHFFAMSRFTCRAPLLWEQCEVDFISSSFFGGMEDTIRTFVIVYYELHDSFLKGGKFVWKEHVLMNWYALTRPNEVMLTTSSDQTPTCGDPRFYFQRWYARSNDVEEYSACIPNATVRLEGCC